MFPLKKQVQLDEAAKTWNRVAGLNVTIYEKKS